MGPSWWLGVADAADFAVFDLMRPAKCGLRHTLWHTFCLWLRTRCCLNRDQFVWLRDVPNSGGAAGRGILDEVTHAEVARALTVTLNLTV